VRDGLDPEADVTTRQRENKGGENVLADLRKLSLCLGLGATAALASSAAGAASSNATDSIATTAPAPEHGAADAPAPAPSDPTAVSETCLAQTICSVKERIRWQTPAWTPSQCRHIAEAVSTSAKRHDLSPSLLLAIMVNESDMNEKSARVYTREGKIYAKDGGLMAIRCLLDDHDRCTNGNVRGVAWKDLMDPATNIELGARELAHWREGGGVTRKTIFKRDASGHLQKVTKDVPCQHKTHAYWAHYNHGPRYIDKGYPRHYPHRIAVLDHAFATVMNVPAPELTTGRITIHDPGKRDRTIDRPLEPRYRKLYDQILSGGTCSALALN
jgi:hypothetical protein